MSTLTTTQPTTKTIFTIPPTTTRLTTTTKTTSPTTICEEVCQWTGYFSLHNVTLGNKGGDFENLDMLRNASIITCANPKQIECRPIDTNAETQIIECSLENGLICENKHQITNFLTCYDYEVRFYCCDSSCRSTPFQTKVTANFTIYPVTCTPKCYLTDWIDENMPTPGVFGGDYENLEILKANGKKACSIPFAIECRVNTSETNTSIVQENQLIQCELEVGLICHNADQASKQCYDYEIRYLCCDDVSHCGTGATTLPTTICQCNINGSIFQPGM